MREIKFRAYSHRAKKMYQWEDLTNEEIGDMLRNPQEEIMQYTGLKDKNGKEIYEGDILSNYYVVEMKWDEGMSDECIYGWVFGSRDDIPEKMKVIGNIYENKDLLIK